MHSKTMAHTINEEPCDMNFHGTFTSEPNSYFVTGAELPGSKLESPGSGDQQSSGSYMPTENDLSQVKGMDKTVEFMQELHENILALENGAVVPRQVEEQVMAPLFPGMHSQTQCKSEDDDGYCSRSSLDSPVQTSQSDSETNDQEVFTSKDCSDASCSQHPDQKNKQTVGLELNDAVNPVPTQNDVRMGSQLMSSNISSVSTPSLSSSGSQQKILIVNKAANVKYLIPTARTVLRSQGISKMLSITSSKPPSSQPRQSVPNLVNVKILKPGLNKFLPRQITLLRVPDKENPGSTSIPVAFPFSNGKASSSSGPTTAMTGAQEGVNTLGVSGSSPGQERSLAGREKPRKTSSDTQSVDESPSRFPSESASCVNDVTHARSNAVGQDVDGVRFVEAGEHVPDASDVIFDSPLPLVTTCGTSEGAVATEDCTMSAFQMAGVDSDQSASRQLPILEGCTGCDVKMTELLLAAEPVDAAVGISCNNQASAVHNSQVMVSLTGVDADHVNRDGQLSRETYAQPVKGIAYPSDELPATQDDTSSSLKIDQKAADLPVAVTPSRVKGSGNCKYGPGPTSSIQTTADSDLQKILKACLSSSGVVGESGQPTSARVVQSGSARGSAYQPSSRGSQDVTVILLPHTSVQSVPKKTNAVSEAHCRQVLLRVGQSQVFKAVSVSSENLKVVPSRTDEKLTHFDVEDSELMVNATGSVWNDAGSTYDEVIECGGSVLPVTKGLKCRGRTVISKAANGTTLGERSTSIVKDGTCTGKQLLNPEKEIVLMPKSSANIGHFASLSMSSLRMTNSNSDSLQRLGHSKQLAPSPATVTTAAMTLTKSQRTVSQVGNPQSRTHDVSSSGRNRISRQTIHATRKFCHSMGYLHPLIDHDYCEFSAFCADVQSSIISLTESSIRPERRYVKKNRAARTKAMRVSQYVSDSCSTETRPKRKYCKRKQTGDGEAGKKYSALNSKLRGNGSKLSLTPNKGVASTVKDSIHSSSDDKDYVKIPGCYQDEYVYYATKRLPGRPRNRTETVSKTTEPVVSKMPTTSTGISVFDWYKEMAQTDKTSRFGAAEMVDCAVHGSDMQENNAGKDCTPVDESDVADLVMDMLPSGDLVRPISEDMKFMTSSSIVESLLSSSYEVSSMSTLGSEPAIDVGNTDLNLMAEEVRLMLSSMGEAELKLLESHLGNEKVPDEMPVDGLDINSYLGDYTAHENNMSLSQSSVSNFLDVDDINDGDLLSADIANMNIILNDLNAPNRQRGTQDGAGSKLETSSIGSLFDKSVGNCDEFIGGMHDIGLGFAKRTDVAIPGCDAKTVKSQENLSVTNACSLSTKSSDSLVPAESSPPELTTINMFWNDLPGLLMNGKEFVRLVDIHKQIMPAKDTGILKKRCHMMGLNITNCTELQRDFLIRYMNAAKSKSTVIIARDAAIMLIGFYVNPKSRSRGADDFELDMLTPPFKQAKMSSQQKWPVSSKRKQIDSSSANCLPSTGSLSSEMTAGSSAGKNVCSGGALPHHLGEGISVGCSTSEMDIKRSQRLRHKHIGYSDVDHGHLDASERNGKQESLRSMPSFEENARDSSTTNLNAVAERVQRELENLVKEQKRRRLSVEEKLRLKFLRNSHKSSALVPKPVDLALKGTRRRLLKRTRRTRRLLAWKRNHKGQSSGAGDLHTLEHCYAASPAHLGGSSRHQNITDNQSVRNSDHHTARSENQGTETSASSTPQTSPLPVTKIGARTSGSTSIGVIHRDVTCRINRRRRSQIGELIPPLYTSNDAHCICCSNCQEMLSVPQFLKHMHWRRGSDKLVRVTIAQKMQLQSSSRTPHNLAVWEDFQKKRARFEGMLEARHSVMAHKITSQRAEKVMEQTISEDGLVSPNPSTRHSSRVSKRKLLHPVEKYVFAKTQAIEEVTRSSSDQKKRRQAPKPDNRSSAVVGKHTNAAPSVNFSRLSRRQKPSLSPGGTANGRARKQSYVASDRLLRVTTRRSQDSRLTSLSDSN